MGGRNKAVTGLIGLAMITTACAGEDVVTTSEAPSTTSGTPAVEFTTTTTEAPAPPGATARVVEIDWDAAAVSSRPTPGFELEVAPLRITVPLPDGWVRWVGGWAVLRLRAEPPYGAGITFERPLALYADRCRWYSDGLVEIGPTVDDLVAAVVAHPQYGATNVRDVALSGFSGKEFEMLGVPDGLDTGACSLGDSSGDDSGSDYRPWAGRFMMGDEEMNVVRVLDVGGERVVIRAVFFPGTPEDTMAELFAMFDAISIEIEG